MAYKRTTKKSGNSKLTRTFNTNGKRTSRTTFTRKAGNMTLSESTNDNGTVRRTTTINRNGWIDRKTTTIGSKKTKRKNSKSTGAPLSGFQVFIIGLIVMFIVFG